MITSSNFFNKSLFSQDQQQHRQTQQIGPWLISKTKNYETIDTARKYQNRSELRYMKKRHSQFHSYSQHKQQNNALISLNLQLKQKNQLLNHPDSIYQKYNKNELFLPKIQNILKRKLVKPRQEALSGRFYNSPLVYQLNFITSKSNKKTKKMKYVPDYNNKINDKYDVVGKYLSSHQNSKFNIYEKCVIQVKRKQPKSKQLQEY